LTKSPRWPEGQPDARRAVGAAFVSGEGQWWRARSLRSAPPGGKPGGTKARGGGQGWIGDMASRGQAKDERGSKTNRALRLTLGQDARLNGLRRMLRGRQLQSSPRRDAGALCGVGALVCGLRLSSRQRDGAGCRWLHGRHAARARLPAVEVAVGGCR